MKQVRLIDGPRSGQLWTVRDLDDTVIVPVFDEVDITGLGDIAKTYASTNRMVLYRARRIRSTGHVVHNYVGEALFECGES